MGSLVVIVGVILMVVIHEGGHFIAAKAFDMKATEAFFGFGPRLWSITRGETEYGVKAIPLGGYVRITGMNPFEEIDPAEEHRTYRRKPFWQKSVVVLAGIASHFVVAFVIFVVVALVWGTVSLGRYTLDPAISDVTRVLIRSSGVAEEIPLELERGDEIVRIDGDPVEDLSPVSTAPPGTIHQVEVERGGAIVTLATTDVVVPTPAYLAGMQAGDRLVSIDGRSVEEWDDFVEGAHLKPAEETTIVFERDGEEMTITTVLAVNEVDGEAVGFFGVSPSVTGDRVGPVGAVTTAGSALGTGVVQAGRGLADLVANFGNIVHATVTSNDEVLDETRPISVIGLVRIAGPLEQSLVLLAFVNIFVGVLNVVPLYPLDGGHFAVALYERLRGRPADVRKLMPVAAAVFIFVVMLGLLGIYLDIVNPLRPPGQ
jgi:RIP metalloprotease RseP